MLTLRDIKGPSLAVHVVASYAFTLIVIVFVYFNWKKMVELRHAWFQSTLIQRVPRKYQSDEGTRSIPEPVQVP